MRIINQFPVNGGAPICLPPSFTTRAVVESFGAFIAHIEYDRMLEARAYTVLDVMGGHVPDGALYIGSVIRPIPHCPPVVHHLYAVPA